MPHPPLTESFLDQQAMSRFGLATIGHITGRQDGEARPMTAPAPFVRYRGRRPYEDQHPARPLVWALVWIVVPAFWAGTVYWLAQAVY